ncbi:MAG: hypothetical protein WD906_04715 [Anaerolineales bacterium]
MPETVPVAIADRSRLANLVSQRLPADALAAYYALNHPGARVRLVGLQTSQGDLVGFAVEAQTGHDLFRPLVIPVASQPEGLLALLDAVTIPGRSFFLHLPLDQQPWIGPDLTLDQIRPLYLYRSDPRAFPMEVNVLIVESTTPDGLKRFEIRSRGEVVAAAGLNWRSPYFAEVYVEGTAEASNRGLTRSVFAAATGHVLREHLSCLTFVDDSDAQAQAMAEWVGYRRTGDRYFVAHAVRQNGAGIGGPP